MFEKNTPMITNNYIKIVFLVLLSFIVFSCDDEDDGPTPIERAVPELGEKLSDLNLFKGAMVNLEPIETVYIYDLKTALHTDYAHKMRFISLPEGESMVYDGGGFPIYPNNTIFAKTFYYLNDERDESLGKKIIETRVLIKKSGIWEIGNYIWNQDMTDALRDEAGVDLPISWINEEGIEKTFTYSVPDYAACVKCHQKNGERVPIGPKIRNMHTEGQLQQFIDLGILTGAPAVSEIETLPNWEDDVTYNIKQRARAYLDVNCAHCHQSGGFFNLNHFDDFDFSYELSFEEANIINVSENIGIRMSLNPSIEFFMPQIGVNLRHEEGYALMQEYVDGL